MLSPKTLLKGLADGCSLKSTHLHLYPKKYSYEKAKPSKNGKSSRWIETKKNGKCTSFIAPVRIIEILVGFYLAVQVSSWYLDGHLIGAFLRIRTV